MGQVQSQIFTVEAALKQLQGPVVPFEHQFWSDLLASVSLDTSFELSSSALTSLVTEQPTNLAILLYRVTDCLHKFLRRKQDVATSERILVFNALMRILSWVVPVVLSAPSSFRDLILYSIGPLDSSELYVGPCKISYPLPSSEEVESLPHAPASKQLTVLRCPGRWERGGCLAQCLASLLTDTLFVEGYTVPPTTESNPLGIW
jgi:hypothetical protein